MAKKKKKTSQKKSNQQNTLEKIEDKRTAGATTIERYEYQFLCSCYILLKFLNEDNPLVRFEGFEDIDTYILSNNILANHNQVKMSQNKQDASFMYTILENYLEVYLLDKGNKNRYFTLIYDFEVAKGNLTKLIDNKLDEKSVEYWKGVIDKISLSKPYWNWKDFDFNSFINQLRFENIKKNSLTNLSFAFFYYKLFVSPDLFFLRATTLALGLFLSCRSWCTPFWDFKAECFADSYLLTYERRNHFILIRIFD